MIAHGDAREGKWRGNWRMELVGSTLHATSELGVSSITTADAHTSAASSRLNWRYCLFKWTRPFRRKTKSGFCTCAITFQTQSNTYFFSTATVVARKPLSVVISALSVLFNPLNPELNPICYTLALLGAHHFLHVSRIRVKLLTFRLLMSYIYIYVYMYIWSTHSWCF